MDREGAGEVKGGEAGESGDPRATDESIVGKRTSETTCQGQMNTLLVNDQSYINTKKINTRFAEQWAHLLTPAVNAVYFSIRIFVRQTVEKPPEDNT